MNAAASVGGNPVGSGTQSSALTTMCVANAPMLESPATPCPGFRCFTPSPTASITPANSEPGMNGSGGFIWYLPCTINRSGKFRLAA